MSAGKTISLLLTSLVGSDFYILFAFIITLVLFAVVVTLHYSSKKSIEEWKFGQLKRFPIKTVKRERIFYTAFCTLISLFPLLGMFGTVKGLLGLDLATGDMENIKNNFFGALTSTAWGIIFSCLFKLLNVFIVDAIEDHIEFAKREEEKTIERNRKYEK